MIVLYPRLTDLVVTSHSFRVAHPQCCDSTALRRKHSLGSSDCSTSTEHPREHRTVLVYLSAHHELTVATWNLSPRVRTHAMPVCEKRSRVRSGRRSRAVDRVGRTRMLKPRHVRMLSHRDLQICPARRPLVLPLERAMGRGR